MNWYLEVLKKYATFSGRARRKEYWMFVLFNMIFTFIITFVDSRLKLRGFFAGIYAIAIIIPSIAVCVRRLHDIGKSGAWYFISFIPLIGSIWKLVLMCREGDYGINEYGENPKMYDNY